MTQTTIYNLGYSEFINQFGKKEDKVKWNQTFQFISARRQLDFIKYIIKRDNLNISLVNSDPFFIRFSFV